MKNDMKPEIRFKEFTNAWEQRKLGETVKITMGQSPDGSTYSDTPSDYILVQGNADLQNGYVVPRIWTTQKTKTVDAGDLIMSVRAPAGAMGKTAYNAVIGRGVAGIKGNEFIFQTLVKYYDNDYWSKISVGSTFDSLNSNNLKEAEIMIPSNKEQEKIGRLFAHLDSLIALHQRKCEKLKNVKKSLLEKMFPAEGKDVPEIRFKEFTDAWEQDRLGKITYQVGEKNINALPLESYSVSNQDGFISQREQFKNGGIVSVADKSKSLIISKGTFAYNPARIDIGSIAYLNLDKNVLISPMYETFKANNEFLNDRFLWHWLKSVIFNNIVINNQEGGVRTCFNLPKFFNSYITIPKDIKEQEKIGILFDGLDSLVALHQRKCEKLKNIKKALLEKMFC